MKRHCQAVGFLLLMTAAAVCAQKQQNPNHPKPPPPPRAQAQPGGAAKSPAPRIPKRPRAREGSDWATREIRWNA